MRDGINKNSSLNRIPEVIHCFDTYTLYKKADYKTKQLHEYLKQDGTHDGIIGSDLPFKYYVNTRIYTPFYQITEGLKKDLKNKK